MAKLTKAQKHFIRWIHEPDQQRKDLEAAKIEIKEKRKVSPQERETLGTDLFTRELCPDRNYSPEKLADLINSNPDAAKEAMKKWKDLTESIQWWWQEITKRHRAMGKEADILTNMFAAMVSGDLVRIRTCVECGEVFIAYKSTNQFHADECRKKFYKAVEVSKPDYKAKHAATNKKWYRDLKKRKERETKAATWR